MRKGKLWWPLITYQRFLNFPDKYKLSSLNEAFATELEDTIEASNADYWIYGHHHVNVPGFKIGRTQLVTNQLGYIRANEQIGFDPSVYFEL